MALGMFQKLYDFQIETHYKTTMLQELDKYEPTSEMFGMMRDIPSLVLVLPVLEHQDESVDNLNQVTEVMAKISALYLGLIGSHTDIVACQNLLVGWSQSCLADEEMF